MDTNQLCIKLLCEFNDLKDWGTENNVPKQYHSDIKYLLHCFVDYTMKSFYDDNEKEIKKVFDFIEKVADYADDQVINDLISEFIAPLYFLLNLSDKYDDFLDKYYHCFNLSIKLLSECVRANKCKNIYTKKLVNPKVDSVDESCLLSTNVINDSLVLKFDALYLYDNEVRWIYHPCVVLRDFTVIHQKKVIVNEEIEEYAIKLNKSIFSSFDELLNSTQGSDLQEIDLDYKNKIMNIFGYADKKENSIYLDFTFGFSSLELLFN